MNRCGIAFCIATLLLVFGWSSHLIAQQAPTKISKFEQDEVMQMLITISDDVKKHYYDKNLHGLDWNANVKNFKSRIGNAASLNLGMS
jgi:hypothetical protein